MLDDPVAPLYSRRMPTRNEDPLLDEIVRVIVDGLRPVRVMLFGSRARGDHHEESDYDLIVVTDEAMSRAVAEHEIRERIHGHGYPVDVILFSPAEYERKRTDVGTLAYASEADGVALYERAPLPPVRRVHESSSEPPESLAEWMRRAESDYLAMEALAKLGSHHDAICLHAHQSAEKFLKAALVRRHVRPPRTHVLRALLARSDSALSDHVRCRDACKLLDDLWPKSRYPGNPEPTAGETHAAIAAAQLVRDLVLPRLG